MWTKEAVAATIDHAALKPGMRDEDIRQACETGLKYGVATVCVRPSDAGLASELLAGSAVKPSVVVGFPHGSNRSEVKALEARLAIEDGAAELDMVINIGKLLSGDLDYVEADIKAVVAEARPRAVPVKVIFEIHFLTPDQIRVACELSERAGAEFVKTSTGFAETSATPEAVATMLDCVGDRLGVKASGGIRDWATSVAFLDQGCTRLGAGSTEAILEGAISTEAY